MPTPLVIITASFIGAVFVKNRYVAFAAGTIAGVMVGAWIMMFGLENRLEECRAYQADALTGSIDCGVVIDGESSEFPWR